MLYVHVLRLNSSPLEIPSDIDNLQIGPKLPVQVQSSQCFFNKQKIKMSGPINSGLINKLWYIHAMEYHTAVKKNEKAFYILVRKYRQDTVS